MHDGEEWRFEAVVKLLEEVERELRIIQYRAINCDAVAPATLSIWDNKPSALKFVQQPLHFFGYMSHHGKLPSLQQPPKLHLFLRSSSNPGPRLHIEHDGQDGLDSIIF
jgi:hypothetical protein